MSSQTILLFLFDDYSIDVDMASKFHGSLAVKILVRISNQSLVCSV